MSLRLYCSCCDALISEHEGAIDRLDGMNVWCDECCAGYRVSIDADEAGAYALLCSLKDDDNANSNPSPEKT
jgi:hypothetical protein